MNKQFDDIKNMDGADQDEEYQENGLWSYGEG